MKKAVTKKQTIILLFIMILLIVAGFKVVVQNKGESIENEIPVADEKAKMIESLSGKTVHVTDEELEEYAKVYDDPYVIYLRKALNGRLKVLGEFKQYPTGQFIVYNLNDSVAGGKDIKIIFKDKPDKMFYAWVYKLEGEETYEVRAFKVMDNLDEDLFREMVSYMQPFLSARYGL